MRILIPCLWLFLPLISQASPPNSDNVASLINNFSLEQPEAFTVDWPEKNQLGNELNVRSFFNAKSVEQSTLDRYKVSFSLSYPIKAIYTYLSPRLEFAIQRVNYYIADEETKITSLKSAFSIRDNSPTSALFWQAYNQYQNDAFYHLKISPCVHPASDTIPCVRPNYSQLFYEYKAYLKDIATQLYDGDSLDTAVKNAQQWVLTIPDREEHIYSFFPPITVLESNQADSDEKALLLATLISQLAPKYHLYMVYPSDSIGSVSPAWLTIDSSSGIKGEQITINNQQHTVISGSKKELAKMLITNTKMISESLY